jgi:predicted alpha/beta-hydrolase family hydrolase
VTDTRSQAFRFEATQSSGEVSAALLVPETPDALYVFAHGAGAAMNHPFMERAARELAARGIATFRYNFPYMEGEKKRGPNPAPVLEKTVRSAVSAARNALPGLLTVAGGKSMGGRMTSRAQAAEGIEGLAGIVFYGFPLHAPGREPKDRAAHLADVAVPLLFLQGTRDRLANLELLEPAIADVRNATLHIVDGGDHSFKVLKRSGRTEDEVHCELADTVADWVGKIGDAASG